MKEALMCARTALTEEQIPVGAVVVYGDEVIGRGHNRTDAAYPFAHAEMEAIARACSRLGRVRLDGCAIYVTLEPCAMCCGAILQARIGLVVWGAPDMRAGACGSLYNIPKDPRYTWRPQVIGGVLKDESAELLRGFFAARRKHKTH